MKKVLSLFLTIALIFSISFTVLASESDLHIETYDYSVSESGLFGQVRTVTKEGWEPYQDNQQISEVEFLELAGRTDLAKEANSHHSTKSGLQIGGLIVGIGGSIIALNEVYKPVNDASTSLMLIGSAASLLGTGAAYYGYNMSPTYLNATRAEEVLQEHQINNNSFIPNINLVNKEIGASFIINF